MVGDFNKLHDILIRMGFKVVACPDHEEKPEINLTVYGNNKGTTVMIEEPDELRIIETIKQKHPVTGNVTSEEAEKLMHAALIKRDTQ